MFNFALTVSIQPSMERAYFEHEIFLNRHAGLDPASRVTLQKVNSGYRIKSGMTITSAFAIVS
jgi:hypothetical protein